MEPDSTSLIACPICYRLHNTVSSNYHFGPHLLCPQCSNQHYWLRWEWVTENLIYINKHDGEAPKGQIQSISENPTTSAAWTLFYRWGDDIDNHKQSPKTFRTPRAAIEAAQYLYDLEVGYPPLYNAGPNPFY